MRDKARKPTTPSSDATDAEPSELLNAGARSGRRNSCSVSRGARRSTPRRARGRSRPTSWRRGSESFWSKGCAVWGSERAEEGEPIHGARQERKLRAGRVSDRLRAKDKQNGPRPENVPD